MNKTLLNQALKFKDSNPSNNQIKVLAKIVLNYQKENEVYFLNIKHNQKPELIDEIGFFKFLSDINNLKINSFNDIEFYVKDVTNRKESIEKTGNSKEYYAKVFDKVIVFQKNQENPILYQNKNEISIITGEPILAVENGETFLNIYKIMAKFGFKQFVYLSGFPNILTKQFLKDKNVVFFLDYDIEAVRLYDSLECKKKSFFKYPNIEDYFAIKQYLNEDLYKKQRDKLLEHHDELQWLIDLIKNYNGVIEQEILN